MTIRPRPNASTLLLGLERPTLGDEPATLAALVLEPDDPDERAAGNLFAAIRATAAYGTPDAQPVQQLSTDDHSGAASGRLEGVPYVPREGTQTESRRPDADLRAFVTELFIDG